MRGADASPKAGELARQRPVASRLTEFYLWLSLGGVLGGIVGSTTTQNYAIARYNLAEAYEPTNPKRALSEYETYLALVQGIPDEADRIALAQQRIKSLKR